MSEQQFPGGAPHTENTSATIRKNRLRPLLRLLVVLPFAVCTFAAFLLCLPVALIEIGRKHIRPDKRALK